ncbi:MAG: hypothetical protein RL156_1743 [Bacteroidota bacterium]|jgi:hypothetical protein
MNRDDIIRMAREAGVLSGYDSDLFQRFAALVAAAVLSRKPLIQEDVDFLVTRYSSFKKHWVEGEVFANWECDGAALVRAVERAHGIGGQNEPR